MWRVGGAMAPSLFDKHLERNFWSPRDLQIVPIGQLTELHEFASCLIYPFMGIHSIYGLNVSVSSTAVRKLERLRSLLSAVPDELALPQLRALVAIGAEPGLSVSDLAERVGVPQQTASRYVAVLLGRYQDPMAIEQGRILVEQRISEEDPRRRALFLTMEGSALLTHIIETAFSGLHE